jgi:hypothetical protein
MSGRVGLTSYTIISRVYRVVFGSRVTTRLIIGSGSCRTHLYNRVSRVDTNPTRMHELPSLIFGYVLYILEGHGQHGYDVYFQFVLCILEGHGQHGFQDVLT